jgi:dihydrofolate reductase
VFTHQKLPDVKNVEFVSGSVPKVITNIKRQSTKNIWLVGGGNLITEFVKYKLIDEFRIFIMPIFLGNGIPILQDFVELDFTKFVKSKSYKNGVTEIYLRAEKQ